MEGQAGPAGTGTGEWRSWPSTAPGLHPPFPPFPASLAWQTGHKDPPSLWTQSQLSCHGNPLADRAWVAIATCLKPKSIWGEGLQQRSRVTGTICGSAMRPRARPAPSQGAPWGGWDPAGPLGMGRRWPRRAPPAWSVSPPWGSSSVWPGATSASRHGLSQAAANRQRSARPASPRPPQACRLRPSGPFLSRGRRPASASPAPQRRGKRPCRGDQASPGPCSSVPRGRLLHPGPSPFHRHLPPAPSPPGGTGCTFRGAVGSSACCHTAQGAPAAPPGVMRASLQPPAGAGWQGRDPESCAS